jgi:hypothetical protein
MFTRKSEPNNGNDFTFHRLGLRLVGKAKTRTPQAASLAKETLSLFRPARQASRGNSAIANGEV